MIKRIHVNQHVMKRNAVITVKTSKQNRTYSLKGASKVVYSPDKPLSCGAKVWMETKKLV
jgi:hypothetical protein